MRSWRRSVSPGDRIAHVGLDDPRGTAKVGVVRETVGSDPQLVVAEWEDEGAPVAFDARELQVLRRVPLLSRGPILIYPHHLWNAIRSGLRRLMRRRA